MFTFTKTEIEHFAQSSGFAFNSVEKIIRLLDVLDQLSKHPFLKSCFVLKGGTALNVFYFDLPRLSVDVDLNYIKEIDKKKMLQDRLEIDQLIPRIFTEQYLVNFSKKEYALSQFGLNYDTLSGGKDRIKLEINYLHRLPISVINNIEKRHFGSNVNYSILGMEELFASKIIALLSRYTPRDLYDVYLMVDNDKTDLKMLRELILYYGLVSRESIFDLFELKLDTITKSDIRKHLLPMLIGKHYPDLKNIKEKVTDFLNQPLKMNLTEKQTIEKFYSTAELKTTQLFSSQALISKVKKTPAFLWKRENIKKIINTS